MLLRNCVLGTASSRANNKTCYMWKEQKTIVEGFYKSNTLQKWWHSKRNGVLWIYKTRSKKFGKSS